METANPERPFTCKTCGKSYKHKPNLIRHCKYECDKIPRFQCQWCLKKFTQNSSLQYHIKCKHDLEFQQLKKFV